MDNNIEEKPAKLEQIKEVLSEKEQRLEDRTEEIAEEMQINIPGAGISLPIRLIALFTLLGGLSIVGSMFADIVDPDKTRLSTYLVRLVVGLMMLFVSYGLLHFKRWSIWLYGIIALIGLTINPAVSVFPIAVVIYLYHKRGSFDPSLIDFALSKIITKIKSKISNKPPTEINRS